MIAPMLYLKVHIIAIAGKIWTFCVMIRVLCGHRSDLVEGLDSVDMPEGLAQKIIL